MNEQFYDQLLDAFDTPDEKVAFYMGMRLAQSATPLSKAIVGEMERQWRIVSNNKSIALIENYVETSIQMLVAEYRSKLQ